MGLATTTLRIGLGTVMAGHGLQKLAGKFGGHGLDGTAQGFEQMGFTPGRPYATAAGAAETVGGSLLALGALTPFGAAAVTGVMATAIAKVHAKNGPWVTDGGFEYNATIIAAAFAITEAGPGFPALDGLLFKRRKGIGWALFELALGLGGAAAVTTLSGRQGQETTSSLSATVSDATSRFADATRSATAAVANATNSVAGKASEVSEQAGGSLADAADSVSSAADSASTATTSPTVPGLADETTPDEAIAGGQREFPQGR